MCDSYQMKNESRERAAKQLRRVLEHLSDTDRNSLSCISIRDADACRKNKACMVDSRGMCKPVTATEELRRSLDRYNQLKFLVVGALVLYVIVIIVLHYNTKTDDEQKRKKYEFIQNVFFGHSGVMVYIFTLIIFTLLLIIFMPFVNKLWSYRTPVQRRMKRLLDALEATPV